MEIESKRRRRDGGGGGGGARWLRAREALPWERKR